MQVSFVGQHHIHRPCLPHEECVGKSTIKAVDQVTCLEGKEPLTCAEKIAGRTIESLLPDEEDLFSGLIDDLGHAANANGSDDEVDLFSSSGGMELEQGSKLHMREGKSVITEGPLRDQSSSDCSVDSEHPSRTLVVRNVESSVEDSQLRVIFEQFGDIRTFCTACRCQGSVIISYYDIRAARIALGTLQTKPFGSGKLDIHYSNPKDDPLGQYTAEASLEVTNCDPSISSTKLHQIFSSFGEIEEIFETASHKLVKYYDTRAAEAALHGFNSSNMLQEQMKLEVCYPGRARSLVQQFNHGVSQGQLWTPRSPDVNVSPQVETRCMKDGYVHGVDSVSEMSVNALPRNAPTQANGGFTSGLATPVTMLSVSNEFGLHEPLYSFNQAKLQNHSTSFHPHSVPVSCGGFVDSGVISYDSLNTIGEFKSVGCRTTEINDSHPHSLGSHSPSMEHIFMGTSRTGSLPFGGHHHIWNLSNSFQHHHLTPMIWSHSPPFINGVCAHGTPKLPVLLEVLPPVFCTVSPMHKQHIMSAPSGSLSFEDSQHAYVGECPKANHHFDPLRVVGFPTTMPHPSEVASHDFAHVTRDRTDESPNSALCSQLISHKTLERDGETTSPISFSRPRGRLRRLSHRRHETASCHADEKKYELNIERVLRGEDKRTTLMIKNIPNKYSSETLLAAIDEHNQGTYDFIYLPLDFKNKCNMGYAFINMIDPLQIVQFHKSFNGKKWEKFHSGKVACLAYARIQGKAALIAHFQESSLLNEDKCCHPILFVTDGPNAGNQEPFPLGTCIQSRRHRTRCYASDANQNQESASSSLEGEASCHIKNSN